MKAVSSLNAEFAFRPIAPSGMLELSKYDKWDAHEVVCWDYHLEQKTGERRGLSCGCTRPDLPCNL